MNFDDLDFVKLILVKSEFEMSNLCLGSSISKVIFLGNFVRNHKPGFFTFSLLCF